MSPSLDLAQECPDWAAAPGYSGGMSTQPSSLAFGLETCTVALSMARAPTAQGDTTHGGLVLTSERRVLEQGSSMTGCPGMGFLWGRKEVLLLSLSGLDASWQPWGILHRLLPGHLAALKSAFCVASA